jgi:hypothetical protein
MKDGIDKFKDDLRVAGLKNPQLFIKKLEQLGLSKLEFNIMKLRYIDGLLIKQMPDLLQIEDRWIKRVHSRAIIKALDGLSVADLLELGVHIEATPRTLYQT